VIIDRMSMCVFIFSNVPLTNTFQMVLVLVPQMLSVAQDKKNEILNNRR